MKNAFVTGGAGFLGLNLVEQLVGAGWEVVVFDRTASKAEHLERLRTRLVEGDITDSDACERAMPENVDAVFHVAGDTSHWKLADARQTKVNVEGTQRMVSTALKRKARRFLFTSSIAAYGFQQGRITEETQSTALDSRINYFRTKRLAELEVHRGIEQGLDAVILNPANIIGPYDSSGWSRFFFLIDEGRLPGASPGRASFCHVREVAKAHISAFEKGRGGHKYLLGGADATFLELIQQIGELLGREVPRKPTPAFLLKAVGRLSLWGSYVTRKEPDLTPEKAALVSASLVCSSEKAEQELGYKSISLRSMLEDCHRWLVKEYLLSR
jgi:nucleoside-diphosphate-sugar epimerase